MGVCGPEGNLDGYWHGDGRDQTMPAAKALTGIGCAPATVIEPGALFVLFVVQLVFGHAQAKNAAC